MTSSPNILEVIDHPQIWRPWFRDPATWAPWRAFLAVLFGLPLDDDCLALYRTCTGRSRPPPEGGFTEAWLVCGRRAGKSFVLALIACYLATFRDWRRYLSPGEVGTIKVIACDRRQARVIHRHCRALLTRVPPLAKLVARDTDEEIVLTNGTVIEIQTASFRAVRGYTLIAALADEVAFWRSDDASANPDREILDALRPAMATIPSSMLLAASSPYARRGALWDAYRQHYGEDDAPALVWHAPTRTMNPTVSPALIQSAYERDPDWAAAAYGAEFRSDIEAYLTQEALDSVTMRGVYELSPRPGAMYSAFVDPSGGSQDSMTMAIAHREGERGVLDAVREVRPPFSPESVVSEFANLCRLYGIHRVSGDRYGGEWPAERFREHGIAYDVAEKTKSEFYVAFLPLVNSRRVDLLDHSRGLNQLATLERRTGRGTGRDIVDHPPRAHDDVANVIAAALVTVAAGNERWQVIVRSLLGEQAA